MQRVDSASSDGIRLKGFEDIRIRVCDTAFVWTEFAPLRRPSDSVFDKRLNVPVVIGNVRAQV